MCIRDRLGTHGAAPYVTHITTGKIIDMGVTDVNNMGAAMAPAAADTLIAHFEDTGIKPDDYDLIISGDLGLVGKDIVLDLMKKAGYDLSKIYHDCGCLIYDITGQDVHSGGSGCGCSAVTLCGKLIKELKEGKYTNILFMATGALMNSTSCPVSYTHLDVYKRQEFYRSKKLTTMVFGAYNRKYAEHNSDFDWLSRDEKVVQRYEKDANCNFIFTASGYKDLFLLLSEVSKKEWPCLLYTSRCV